MLDDDLLNIQVVRTRECCVLQANYKRDMQETFTNLER